VNGQQVWQAKIDPHPQASGFSSPLVFEDYVIVGSSSTEEYVNTTTATTFRGAVVAFNRVTGALIWRTYTTDAPHTGCSVWSSVAVDPVARVVYATDGNNYTGDASDTSDSIFALNLATGQKIWWTQLNKGDVFTVSHPASPDFDFGANPILFDAKISGVTRKLVGAGEKSGTFWALDRQTGGVVWHRDASGGSEIIGGMLNNGAYDGSRILIAGNVGTSSGPGSEPANSESLPIHTPITSVLEALDPATGNVIWERQLPAWVWAPITVANGVGFVAFEKTLQAFNTATGEKLNTYRTEGTITSAPVAVNGTVYFGSGMTYIIGYPDTTFHALALDATGGTGPVDAGPPPADGTFGAIYQQLIVGRGCNTIFCHGGSAGNLLMTSPAQAYLNLVNAPASGVGCAGAGLKRVIPGQPDSSVLLSKISSATPACGGVMPPGSAVTVPQPVIDQVRAWILAGAPNN
jgi:polyvinyl alcohol dehydrogenase (cytochrome)